MIPAIDLHHGQVVRLSQGKREERTVYSDDPVQFVEQFQAAGATRLHVVDLNGAFDGRLANLEVIRQICEASRMTVELGGGLRTMPDIESAWEAGVRDVIIGTRAVEDTGFLRELLNRHGDRVIVGVDAKDGIVATRGWTEKSGLQALDFARGLLDWGCRKIIYTDIATDGMLSGPNLVALESMARAVSPMKVVASGGISSLEDVTAILDLKRKNIAGAITGRALYDGRLDLAQAVQLTQSK
ncbi:1-(5-phosphoribosyl)-5-[(5-phosphoribosylamino)methylideneamino]imidazole-4-carboxamide isomerase [bacterium]|nr:1-(5-phosphoribosyl)-5-[(5-phosphoribosylamino)methylideneamino]imidazole-4-carboxamide isomerase [bacterium]